MYPWMYVVLLGLVLIVYARALPKSETVVQKNTVVQEIEETIEHFAVEMDEQNRAILDLFSKTRQDYEVEMSKLSGRLELLEKQKSQLSQELIKIQVTKEPEPVVQEVEEPAEVVVEADELPPYSLSMKSRYAELFSLYDQGKGVEMIAKKLGMNKGEVNLIIQLSRQEEKARV
jgi:hypothetical protein